MPRGPNKNPSEKVRGRNMQFIGCWVRPELRQQLEEWAEAEGRTFSNLVTRLIHRSFESPVTLAHLFDQLESLRRNIESYLSTETPSDDTHQ